MSVSGRPLVTMMPVIVVTPLGETVSRRIKAQSFGRVVLTLSALWGVIPMGGEVV